MKMLKFTKKKAIIIVLILLAIAGGGYKYRTAKKVVVTPVISESVKSNLELTYEVQGNVESKKTVLVFSPLKGKVKKVNFRTGDQVNKGDVLVELDNSSLTEINNNIEKLNITVRSREKEYNDLLAVYKLGGASKREVQAAKDALDIARLELQNLRSSTAEFKNTIVATVSGVIIESNADENLQIDPSKPLFKIVDVENLKIETEIPNSKIKNIKVGNKVLITSDSLETGKVVETSISEISKISTTNPKFNDAVTNVKIELDKDSGLRPGDIVNIKVVYDEVKDATLISFLDVEIDPATGKTYVYIVDKDNVVNKKEVTLGKTNNRVYEVKSGVNPGDKVLNNALKQFKDGDVIK